MARASASKKQESPGTGHNSGLTSDQRLCLALRHRRRKRELDAEKARISADLKTWGRAVKADLGDDGALQVKTMIESETEEGRIKVEARTKAMIEAKAWAAGDDGQLEMFAPQTKASGESKAFLDGKLSGMDDEPFRNPYGAGTSDHDDFARGWQTGDQVRKDLNEIKPEAPVAQLIEGPGHHDGGDLDGEQEAA